MTAPMTPERLAEIREWLQSREESGRFMPIGEDMARDLLAEVERLRAQVADTRVSIQHRCPRMGEHVRPNPSCPCHPHLPIPCPDCYSIEVRTRRVPFRAAIASGDEVTS